jgi:hypothetical protein
MYYYVFQRNGVQDNFAGDCLWARTDGIGTFLG